jgi:hypothetical protein
MRLLGRCQPEQRLAITRVGRKRLQEGNFRATRIPLLQQGRAQHGGLS